MIICANLLHKGVACPDDAAEFSIRFANCNASQP